ncbi:hypothetical protein D3C80_2028880 [compost metagenome]
MEQSYRTCSIVPRTFGDMVLFVPTLVSSLPRQEVVERTEKVEMVETLERHDLFLSLRPLLVLS